MAQDHEGNPLSVGDNVWIPATITSVNVGGTIAVTTAFGSTGLSLPGSSTHKDKPHNFPDLP